VERSATHHNAGSKLHAAWATHITVRCARYASLHTPYDCLTEVAPGWFQRAGIDAVDQHPQASEVAAIEGENQPRQVVNLRFVLLGQRLAHFEPARAQDIGKFGLDAAQQRF